MTAARPEPSDEPGPPLPPDELIRQARLLLAEYPDGRLPAALRQALPRPLARASDCLLAIQRSLSHDPVERNLWWIPPVLLHSPGEREAQIRLTLAEWRGLGMVPRGLADHMLESAARCELDCFISELPQGQLSLEELQRCLRWCGALERRR